MTAARAIRGQQALPPPPPPPPPHKPRPLLPARAWRQAVRLAPDLTRETKIVAARLTDYCDDGARIVPAPQLGALAHGAEMTRGAVTGCLAVLQTGGWLAAAAGPDQPGQPLLRLCDPRDTR